MWKYYNLLRIAFPMSPFLWPTRRFCTEKGNSDVNQKTSERIFDYQMWNLYNVLILSTKMRWSLYFPTGERVTQILNKKNWKHLILSNCVKIFFYHLEQFLVYCVYCNIATIILYFTLVHSKSTSFSNYCKIGQLQPRITDELNENFMYS